MQTYTHQRAMKGSLARGLPTNNSQTTSSSQKSSDSKLRDSKTHVTCGMNPARRSENSVSVQ